MGEDGNYRVVPKNNNETSSISEGLGLTDFNNFQLDTNPFKLPEDFVPFDYSKLGDSIFDYSQFNFDEMNKQIFIYNFKFIRNIFLYIILTSSVIIS